VLPDISVTQSTGRARPDDFIARDAARRLQHLEDFADMFSSAA